MIWFLLGLFVGGGAGWYFWFLSRRDAVRLDEEKQMLTQEKKDRAGFHAQHGRIHRRRRGSQ
ncbi:MAG: hypothetical protein LR015_12505 [Verrucomicrobia bacterium]|nr:hypothetical protein [Verrucomicrobiota bacterium]